MSNDPHDNEVTDRQMLRRYRDDQEMTMNNDSEQDYEEASEIFITRAGQGFYISRAALRRALESGTDTIKLTAPDGFRFVVEPLEGVTLQSAANTEHDPEERS